MIGAVPAIFKNLEAAQLVALGYSKETGEDWCVVESVTSPGTYKLVERQDLVSLPSDEWQLAPGFPSSVGMEDLLMYDGFECCRE